MGCGASSEARHRHPNNTYITREDLDAASERYLEGAEPSLHASPWDSELSADDDDTPRSKQELREFETLDDTRQRLRGNSIGAECDEPSSIALAARHTVAMMTARFHGIDGSVPPPPPSGRDPDAKPVDTNRMNRWVDEASVHLPGDAGVSDKSPSVASAGGGHEQFFASSSGWTSCSSVPSNVSTAGDASSLPPSPALVRYELSQFSLRVLQSKLADTNTDPLAPAVDGGHATRRNVV